jgi:hypothetical protein
MGPLIVAGAFALMTTFGEPRSYWTSWFWAFLLLGAGMTLVVAPLTTAVFNAVDDAWSGAASGVNNAVARTAQLLAVAAFGAVAVLAYAPALRERLAAADLPPAAERALLAQTASLAETELPAGLPEAQAAEARGAIDDAFFQGFRAVAAACAALALLASLIAALMVRDREAAPGREA